MGKRRTWPRVCRELPNRTWLSSPTVPDDFSAIYSILRTFELKTSRAFPGQCTPGRLGIEAGLATHYVARELAALGHDVKQVPPTYAKPFRQGHKNDFRDAYSVAEAVQRPTTRFVPAKTDEQLDLQALHRVRSRLVSERTAVINQIRGFLLERGIIVRQGLRFLRQALPDILAKRTDLLSPRMVRIVRPDAGSGSAWRLDESLDLSVGGGGIAMGRLDLTTGRLHVRGPRAGICGKLPPGCSTGHLGRGRYRVPDLRGRHAQTRPRAVR